MLREGFTAFDSSELINPNSQIQEKDSLNRIIELYESRVENLH